MALWEGEEGCLSPCLSQLLVSEGAEGCSVCQGALPQPGKAFHVHQPLSLPFPLPDTVDRVGPGYPQMGNEPEAS